MSKVFVSHASEDNYFVKELTEFLEKQNISNWVDSRQITVGDDWRSKIDAAIKDSYAVILVWSRDAKRSEYVNFEWAFALGAGIELIPILLKKASWPERLSLIQYLDFSTRHIDLHPWGDLEESLSKAKSKYEARQKEDQEIAGSGIVDLILDSTEFCSSDSELYWAAPIVLSRIGSTDPQIISRLRELVKDGSANKRTSSIRVLGAMKDAGSVPLLICALSDEEYSVRLAAKNALVEIGEPATTNLIKQLNDKQNAILRDGVAVGRINALFALEGIMRERIFPLLVNLLNDEDHDLRGMSAKSMGDLRIEEATPYLAPLLEATYNVWYFRDEGGRKLSEIAWEALNKINTPEALNVISEWQTQFGLGDEGEEVNGEYTPSDNDLPF